MASNQDYWQIGVNGFDPGKELETVDLRHADIGNDNAIILKSNTVQRIQCAWKISNLKTGKLKRLTSGAAEGLVIVDKDNEGVTCPSCFSQFNAERRACGITFGRDGPAIVSDDLLDDHKT